MRARQFAARSLAQTPLDRVGAGTRASAVLRRLQHAPPSHLDAGPAAGVARRPRSPHARQRAVHRYTQQSTSLFAAERRRLHHGARSYRSISRARRALSSKPAGRRCCCRSTGQTGERMDARPLHRPCSAYGESSGNNDVRTVAYLDNIVRKFSK